MFKIEMVRCFVTSPHRQMHNPEGEGKQVRYIPMEIFRLWKFIMVNVKDFNISEEVRSIWVDEELYCKEKPTYGEHEADRVVQVFFKYFMETENGRSVIRYFPYEYFNQIIQFFMRNFSSEYIRGDVEKTDGYFVVRR